MYYEGNLNAVNFTIDRKLVDFIQERMDRLKKYYDKIVSSDVFEGRKRQVIKKIKLLRLNFMSCEMIL